MRSVFADAGYWIALSNPRTPFTRKPKNAPRS